MPPQPKKLHLGCFDKVEPGWLNVDKTSHIFLSRIPGLPYLLFKFGFLSKRQYVLHQRGIFNKVKYLDVSFFS